VLKHCGWPSENTSVGTNHIPEIPEGFPT